MRMTVRFIAHARLRASLSIFGMGGLELGDLPARKTSPSRTLIFSRTSLSRSHSSSSARRWQRRLHGAGWWRTEGWRTAIDRPRECRSTAAYNTTCRRSILSIPGVARHLACRVIYRSMPGGTLGYVSDAGKLGVLRGLSRPTCHTVGAGTCIQHRLKNV